MPAKAPRKFEAIDAKRERTPLLIGLTGPSGGGKTFTALRLAEGIRRITGGEIAVIDTEARRALHYADRFKFKHIQMDPPFGSLDYLEAIRYAAGFVKGGAVIVDSMSHEHEGPGGLIDLHESELNRMAGDDYGKRERMTMLAWQKPKAARRALINGILQINANFIFCFRAKATSKPIKNPETGKTEIVSLGYMPIAGEEFIFEQTLNALLLPGAKGRPSWHSDSVGERAMIKLPEQFRHLAERQGPLTEDDGEALALWASGGAEPAAGAGRQGDTSRREEAKPGDANKSPAERATELSDLIKASPDLGALGALVEEWGDEVRSWPKPTRQAIERARRLRVEELEKAAP